MKGLERVGGREGLGLWVAEETVAVADNQSP